jgi:hypothetical protein
MAKDCFEDEHDDEDEDDRMEGWKGGRVERWKNGRIGHTVTAVPSVRVFPGCL